MKWWVWVWWFFVDVFIGLITNMSNPNLMSFRFTHSMYCVFTYLFTQWDEYGYMNYVEYLPQYTYEYHHDNNHHFIIARLCSFFLSLLHTRKSITNSKFIGFAFELSKPILLLPNECLSLVENVKLVWKEVTEYDLFW